MKMVASGVNGYRATVPCLRPLGEVPPTHLSCWFRNLQALRRLAGHPNIIKLHESWAT